MNRQWMNWKLLRESAWGRRCWSTGSKDLKFVACSVHRLRTEIGFVVVRMERKVAVDSQSFELCVTQQQLGFSASPKRKRRINLVNTTWPCCSSCWFRRSGACVWLLDWVGRVRPSAVHPTAIVPLSSQKEFIQKLTTDFLEKMANEREQEPTRRWDCFLCLIKYQMLKVDCKTRKSSKSIEKLIQMSSTIIASSTSKIRVEKCQWKRPINQQSNKQLNAQTATNVQVESMNQENNGNGSVQPMHNLPASAEPIGQKSAK